MYDSGTVTYDEYLTSDDTDRYPSNANAASRPEITKAQTRRGDEFRLRVDATNPTGFTNFDTFPSPPIKPRMDVTINSFSVSNESTSGATFSWTLGAFYSGNTVNNSLDVYSQIIRVYNSSDVLIYTAPAVTPGTLTTTISSPLLVGGQTYTAELEVIAQDGYATGNDPTVEYAAVEFTVSTQVGPFTLSNALKYTPGTNGSTSGTRTITVNIGQAANADRYEVEIWGRYQRVGSDYDVGLNTPWQRLQSLDASPYIFESSRSGGILTYTRTGLTDYLDYRVTARAKRGTTESGSSYSGGGTGELESQLVFTTVNGTAPTAPVISNISTNTDAGGSFITFTNSYSNSGSNNHSYFEYSLNNGSSWLFNNNVSSVNPIYTGFITFTAGKLYVTAGSTINLRIRATNQDGLTSSQSNLLTITSASVPGSVTSPVVRSFSANRVTLFFTSGSNTGSVNGTLFRTFFSGNLEQFENIENFVNVGSNTAAKISFSQTASSSAAYQVYATPYTSSNKGGFLGTQQYITDITPGGQHAMTVSNFVRSNRTTSSLTITWSGSGSVNRYRARLFRTSDNALMEDKGYTLTSAEATFTGLAAATNYYVIVNPRYEYTSTVFEDGTQAQSGNFQTQQNFTAPTPGQVTFLTSPARFSVAFTGGSGPWFQGWYVAGSPTRPTVSVFDSGTATQTSPMTWTFGPAAGTTYYFWMRSAATSTSNTFEDVGEWSTTSSSFTGSNPTISLSISPSSGTAGTTTFTATPTTTGNPSPTVTYQWEYFEGGSFGFQPISGATSSTYTPPSNYVTLYGSSLRCVATATNYFTSASASAAVTVNAPVLAPTNATLPTLSPTTIAVGTQLSAGIGTWNNNPTSYDIRIYRGTQNVATFETLVASRTGSSTANLTYTITQADYDSGQRYFRTFVDASNSGGSSGLIAGQERGPTGTAPVSAPTNTVAPSVTPSSGTTATNFSCSTGTWTNSPTSYSYQWQYFESPFGWISVGQTNSTWTPGAAYAGTSIRCQVTASNSGGSNSATSNAASVSAGGGGTAPATPTGVGLSGSGSVSWTASTGATSYEIEFFTAQNSSGLNAAGPYSVTGISSSPYQLTSPYASPNNWARVRVRARNSNGASAYSAWVPSASTYT